MSRVTMNNERKLALLDAVSYLVTKGNFNRLCHGDLAFLQDAVLNDDFVSLHSVRRRARDSSLDCSAELYKLIPKTITINGIEVPEPVRKPLEEGQYYYAVFGSDALKWVGDCPDFRLLKQGRIHLTGEARDKHQQALVEVSGGEA